MKKNFTILQSDFIRFLKSGLFLNMFFYTPYSNIEAWSNLNKDYQFLKRINTVTFKNFSVSDNPRIEKAKFNI